jgi:hypothetical protein
MTNQISQSENQSARSMLRHTVATLAYRGAKALRGAPAEFRGFEIRKGSRTPGQILAHICDLLDWALTMAEGEAVWHDSEPSTWERDTARFHEALKALDGYLASERPLHNPAEKLFQGPIADALTHVGQIAMLRRLAGAPIHGENYYRADIQTGRAGTEQAAPRREFD